MLLSINGWQSLRDFFSHFIDHFKQVLGLTMRGSKKLLQRPMMRLCSPSSYNSPMLSLASNAGILSLLHDYHSEPLDSATSTLHESLMLDPLNLKESHDLVDVVSLVGFSRDGYVEWVERYATHTL